MCGRFSREGDAETLIKRYGLTPNSLPELEPRYNIAPGQFVPVIVQEEGPHLSVMRWGLVPSWSKDEKTGYRTINARAETVAQKPMFKGAIKKRRCLVPADGYYEWEKQRKRKLPWRFVLKSGDTFSFAGLWDHWKKPDGKTLYTFTIITTAANALNKKIHDRMPVILHR
jgi:putative SOS response-associated peptidase YedK